MENNRLKERRLALGLSLGDVAAKIGTSRQNVDNTEKRANITMATFKMYADVYRCTPAYLAGLISEEENKAVMEGDAVRKAYLEAGENVRAAVRLLLGLEAAK